MSDPMEFTGKYTSCKVFTQDIEQGAISQIYEFLNCPAFEGAQIRIMPDVHAGSGAVIGFTALVGDKIVPNTIGVDIGCGVQAVDLGMKTIPKGFQWFDDMLRANVPAGFSLRARTYPEGKVKALFTRYISPALTPFIEAVSALAKKVGADEGKVWLSAGTLGSGNHYHELDKDPTTETLWLTVHSGSRNFGLRVATYHQNKAVATMGKRGGLEWLEGANAQEYLADMRVAQNFAMLNRLIMLETLVDGLGLGFKLPDLEMITSVHNYIGEDNIIRKGAISALAGQKLLIPWNMRDGLLVGLGKGNAEWNNSAPHGSGRRMARGQAKRELSVNDFKADMEGIWSSCVGKETLDESPAAYKPTKNVLGAIGDTVDVVAQLKPVYNFKAGKE